MAGPPSPPSIVSLYNVTNTSVDARFSDGPNDGDIIDGRTIGYGTRNAPEFKVGSDGSTIIGELTPGTTWYFWAQTHNSYGWSSWGPRAQVMTKDVPDAPGPITITDITQVSLTATFAARGNGGAPILGMQVGYSYTPDHHVWEADAPAGIAHITGLDPYSTYYLWARVRNTYGWGAWSVMATAKTIAGGWMNVNGVYKPAVPYVNVGGIWKVGEPWGRVAGFWGRGK